MNNSNTNEQSGSLRADRNSGNTSGLSVGSQVPNPIAKPTDFKTITGAFFGDHRVKGTDAKLPGNPGPREQMTQVPLSVRTPAEPKPMTTLDQSNIGG